MEPADAKLYGGAPGVHPPFAEDPHPPVKTDKLEREEQREFANWCLLHDLAPVWHSTAHRSKASKGCPDFVVTVNGETLWIEFKRAGFDLSLDQENFKARVERNGGLFFIVFCAAEAIALCQKYALDKDLR